MRSRKSIIKLKVFILISIISLITLLFWILDKDSLDIYTTSILRYLSQITALIGTIYLSIDFILAARLRWIEKIIGGLDKVYRYHIFFGAVGYFLIFLHPLLLALRFTDDVQLFSSYFLIDSDSTLPQVLGISGFWLFTILILLSGMRKLSYEIWRLSHKFMGVPLLLGAAHAILVSDTFDYLPMQLWFLLWIILGLAAYIYKVFLYEEFGSVYKYVVEKVNKYDEGADIYLKPSLKHIKFEPGQFVFVRFQSVGLNTEVHPYTISSAPGEEFLRLSIKGLGDWSSKVKDLVKKDDDVKIWGPYGEFIDDSFYGHERQVWIGGGIGVTPFLSKLRSMDHQNSKYKIGFIYTDNTKEETVYAEEIKSYTPDNVKKRIHYSDDEGYLSVEDLKKINDGTLENTNYLLCGPKPLIETLKKQLMENGIDEDYIIFEYFNFK